MSDLLQALGADADGVFHLDKAKFELG